MKNKYNARKTVVDGIVFASKAEASRYRELKLMHKSGVISDLELQPEFVIIPKQKGERAAVYTADFVYMENGRKIVEEVKSVATRSKPDYVLRRKLFKQKFGNDYDFKETVR